MVLRPFCPARVNQIFNSIKPPMFRLIYIILIQIHSSLSWIWSSTILLIPWLNLSTSLTPIFIFFNLPISWLWMQMTVTCCKRWVTFVSLHNYGWAQVGVRFHIQRAFVINMAANSLYPRPTCTPAPCFSFTDDSVYAVRTLCTCSGGGGAAQFFQSGSSWVGWSWWPTPARTSQLVHSRDPKKNKPGSLQKNRDACARGTEWQVRCHLTRLNQSKENFFNKDI